MTALLTEVCGECGNLRVDCSNPDAEWFPQRTMCYATADLAVLRRRAEQRFGHPEKQTERHPRDGMHLWVSSQDASPDDDFLSVPTFGEQGLADGHQADDGDPEANHA